MKANQQRFLLGRPSRTGRAALAVFAVIALCSGLMPTALADTLLSETFEGYFPEDNGWAVGDSNTSGTAAYWNDVYTTFGTVAAHTGAWKGYCAGYGYAGTSTSPFYTNDMNAYMRKTLDLRNYCYPQLSFYYRIPGIESCCDRLLVSVGGTIVFSNATPNGAWAAAVVDLSPWAGSQPTLEFTFVSDYSVQYEGVYLDDILVTATPATATIYSVWWGPQQDTDGDGCWTAPNDTFRLYWDPDVSCSGYTWLSVFEKIYRAPCGSSTWTLYYTTAPHTITGTLGTDQQYLDIPASSGCTCYDYRILIYRTGQIAWDWIFEYGGHQEELLSQEKATIYNAWWGPQQDLDGDGCWASAGDDFRLYWDADVVGASGILTVFEKIYLRSPCGSGSWTLFLTTPNHSITNNYSSDAVYMDMLAGYFCYCYDYRIEVYRAGQTVPDYTMDSSNNSALANHREEYVSQDWPTVKIYNAWWVNQQDTDGDGCWTAPSDTFRLVWDPDVTNCAATMYVHEKVYYRPSGAGSWTLYAETAPHLITNCLGTDSMYVDLPAHSGCAMYDYRIALYRLDHSAPDFVADPSNFPVLGSHKEEFQSEEKATIYAPYTYWYYQQDHDGDGCWASTNDYFRLVWDSDVVNCSGTLTVFEKVYWQNCGTTTWNLYATTANHVIDACLIDATYVDIPAGPSCNCYNYKIEVYRAGQTVPDFILSQTNYPSVLGNHREEYYSQDECLATVADAWWAYQQDHDGDGCWASTNNILRLTWDPDVVNCSGSLAIFEKVYLRICGNTTWSLWTTTTPHIITGISTLDQQYVDFPAGSSCGCWDYKIEVYRSGQTVPDYTRDPSNDADLSNHHEELYAQDECLATIWDAWWAYQQDHDGDGCLASTNDVFRLYWDPDVVNCSGSLTVIEKVYFKRCASNTWTLGYTSSPHTITGTSTADQQYVDIGTGYGCGCWDYKIEVYRSGQTTPDYSRDPSNDSDLGNRREEFYAQDECLATIWDAWWAGQQDHDGDGCWATNGNWFRLVWDPDVVNCSGSLTVFERVYFKSCVSNTWELLASTAPHTITGTSIADQQYLEFTAGSTAGSGCWCFDYKIEVYRSGQSVPDYSRDPSNDGDLGNHREEQYLEDECSLSTATVVDAWWTYQADTDGDGCWEPLGAANTFRLNWDPDVVGCHGSISVFERVYWRSFGQANWYLLATNASHLTTGTSTADQQYVDIPTGFSCNSYDYRIEVYQTGQTTPDYARDPGNDPDLANHKEELAVERPRFTSIRRNLDGTITVEWTGGGTLQAAPSVTGVWTDVTGATSPYTFTPPAPMLFFRVRQ